MKRAVLLLITCVFVGFAMAGEHMKFKGVPIDGPKDKFVQQLKDMGYKYVGDDGGIVMMEGEFNGIKGCDVVVLTYSGGMVFSVSVAFPEEGTWGELHMSYARLKDGLLRKYSLIEEEERFNSAYLNDFSNGGDLSRYYAIQNFEGVFKSVFKAENGLVSVAITSHNDACFVVVIYADEENLQKYKASIDDL